MLSTGGQRPLASNGAALATWRRARREAAGGEHRLQRDRHGTALKHRDTPQRTGRARSAPRGEGRGSPALPGPPVRRSPPHPAGPTHHVAGRSEKAGGRRPPHPPVSGPRPPPFWPSRGGRRAALRTAGAGRGRPPFRRSSQDGGGQRGAGGGAPLQAALRHLRG